MSNASDIRPYLTALFAITGSYAAYLLYAFISPYSSLRNLPGPPSPSWIWGNVRDILAAEHSVLHEQWIKKYGNVIMYRMLLNSPRMTTTDLRALNHVLSRGDIYEKPGIAQRELSRLLGAGVLIAEGEAHRKQRRVMNPAFGPGQLRDLTHIFLNKANELRDVFSQLVADSPTPGPVKIDVVTYLSRATLDIIGLAGFDYTFDSLSGDSRTELATAFRTVFRITEAGGMLNILMFLVPALRGLPVERNLSIKRARAIMDRIGLELINDRKMAFKNGTLSSGRDLLSLLVKANTSSEPKHQLSDKDVLAQIPTFLAAGHETTSTATTWALYALSLNQDVQTRLRAELRANPLPTAASGNEPLSQEELTAFDKLPLLDAVVRETLRLHAPVPSSIRMATKDDVIPLAKPFTDLRGVEKDSFTIAKGESVFIPILAINRSKELWGEDANEWRPERWLDGSLQDSIRSVPGVWGNMLTFLGGSHACIGFRFSLYEMKILLHALVTQFEFALAVKPEQLKKKSGVVTRPTIEGEKHKGAQMPLLVSIVHVED